MLGRKMALLGSAVALNIKVSEEKNGCQEI